jgi:RecB family exonuclease
VDAVSRFPLPVETVEVPAMFSPSQLYQGASCRLRAVLTKSKTAPRLPSHPAAERGNVLHALFERAALGTIPREAGIRAAVVCELSLLLDEAEARLRQSPQTAHFARLETAWMPVEWRNGVERALTTAIRLLETAPPYSPRGGQRREGHVRFQDLGTIGRWPEVEIEAPHRRLAGRMDLVEKLPGARVVVRDFKTGRTRDREGALLAHIVAQMRLYALAILEVSPAAHVELRISDEGDHEVSMEEDALNETVSWLEGVLAGLPAGARLGSSDLASPGPECDQCPFRHVCSGYLREAPRLWKTGTEDQRMPLDLWGDVLAVASQGSQWVLDVQDAAGRRARVTRLDGRHEELTRVCPGMRVWMFGLSAATSPIRGRWFHPRNFYELPAETNQRRAWSLAIFAEA